MTTIVFASMRYNCCNVPRYMNLLKLGYDLVCGYKSRLGKSETTVTQDLRLAVYAIESTVLHQEGISNKLVGPTHSSTKSLLNALGDLRATLNEYEIANDKGHQMELSLSLVIDELARFIELEQNRTICAVVSSDEALRISRGILSRLSKSS